MSTSSVRVAVRVRPLTAQEVQQRCSNVITFAPDRPQITINNERSFTFDYAYPPSTDQQQVYESSVMPLLEKFLDGYNSTILAYGQTGSGKTYSMGIGIDSAYRTTGNPDGIVPRFIDSLFDRLATKEKETPNYSCQVFVSFLELYNEDLVDLLNPVRRNDVVIREDTHGNICWLGVREEPVRNPHELLGLLHKGSVARTTASTDMNRTSSRSHAIFSVILKQNIPADGNMETRLVSKFHFVDLAGSERLKRTNAVGDRAKEGISINTGLLALGNVISALGDESRKVSHIPYRDSKLTRLLQDSLGGNSQTLMMACVSPADVNYTETLNTLKYANRARNIRNRVTVNQELRGGETERLKAQVIRLKEELRGNVEFLHAVNHEMDSLKSEVESLNTTIARMADELAATKYERDILRHQQQPHNSPDPRDSLIAEYAQTIEKLRIEISKLQQSKQHTVTTFVNGLPSPAQTPLGDEQDRPPPLPNTNANNNNNKKKRHSYKFGSKRSMRGRKRHSMRASTTTTTAAGGGGTPKSKALLEQAKTSLEDELAYLSSIKADSSLASDPRVMQFANSFQGSTNLLLDRFEACLACKQSLIQQLETAQAQKADQERALADLTNKKNAMAAQHKRELNDIVSQYESRIKKQTRELQALKRKHAQLAASADSARAKSNAVILGLKQKLDKANQEKKRLTKRMKQDSDRSRERCSHYEREIQKLKRGETQAVAARKRIERDLLAQKATVKRAAEDMATLSNQMKQVALVLKKIMHSKDTNTRALLAKALACATVVRHRTTTTTTNHIKLAPLQQRVFEKKRVLQHAISMHVQSLPFAQTTIAELRQKREHLAAEQTELLSERRQLLRLSPSDAASSPQYMDDRIDIITIQLDFLDHQIAQLEQQQQRRDDCWTDDVRYHQEALAVLRSLAHEDAKLIAEFLLDQLIQHKQQIATHAILIRHMDKTIQKLQHALVDMRRSNDIQAAFAKAFGPIQFIHGLALPLLQAHQSTPVPRHRKRSLLPYRADSAPSLIIQ